MGRKEREKQERFNEHLGSVLEYLERVEALLKGEEEPDGGADEGEEEQDRQRLFVTNVLEEIRNYEDAVACDFTGSRVLELLIQKSDLDHLVIFAARLSGQRQKLAYHQFGSHVLQSLLCRLAVFLKTESAATDPTSKAGFDLVRDLAGDFQANLVDGITTSYASHVLRALLCILAGLPTADVVRSRNSKRFRSGNPHSAGAKGVAVQPPPQFKALLLEFATAMRESAELKECLLDDLGSPVVQTLLLALHKEDKPSCAALCAAIAGNAADPNTPEGESDLEVLVHHRVGSHAFEKLLEVCEPELFHCIYVSTLRNKLVEMATHPSGNFIVQRLIQHAPSRQEIELIINQLMPRIEALLAENRPLVLVKMVEACARFSILQREIFKAVLAAFHVDKPEQNGQMFVLFLGLMTTERYTEVLEEEKHTDQRVYIEKHGSLLLQALMTLDPTIVTPLLRSGAKLTERNVVFLAKHPSGSRALESLLKVRYDEKRMRKFLAKFKGQFAELAKHKFGSHIVDTCWATCDVKFKEVIAKELLAEEHKLQEDFIGRKILRNCRIQDYKRRRQDWVESLESEKRKRSYFADILGDEPEEPAAAVAPTAVRAGKARAQPVDDALEALGFGGAGLPSDSLDVALAPAMDDSEGDGADPLLDGKKKKRRSSKKRKQQALADDGSGKARTPRKKNRVAKDLQGVLEAIEGSRRKAAPTKPRKANKAGQ